MIQDRKGAIDFNIVGWIAVDLSKSFNNLPYGLLMDKFHVYGVELSACKLLYS